MPSFVPVYDPEVPRSEQDPHSHELLKHRKWDNPHSLLSKNIKDDSSNKHSTLSYYRDKYNDTYNKDDKRFYRKNVRDEFDYAPPKRKKSLKPSNKHTSNDCYNNNPNNKFNKDSDKKDEKQDKYYKRHNYTKVDKRVLKNITKH